MTGGRTTEARTTGGRTTGGRTTEARTTGSRTTGKTKVMRCQVRIAQAEESGKYPCGVCRQGVGDNSVKCVACHK